MNDTTTPDWWIFKGHKKPHDGIEALPPPPPWREFTAQAKQARGTTFEATDDEKELVNAALYLSRPLLVTGSPGVGKTSLTYAVAHELKLGEVLRWSITTRTTLKDGLYSYDSIARLQAASLAGQATAPPIEQFLRLGPLGTAFAASDKPRVLLIDEIDKSDIDLPNDLLHIFEEGEFEIPELARLPEDQQKVDIPLFGTDDSGSTVSIKRGKVRCTHFPLVIMTSNGEREFPQAFLRRCLRLEMAFPDKDKLARIVDNHLDDYFAQLPKRKATAARKKMNVLIDDFLRRSDTDDLATDQLLNAAYLVLKDVIEPPSGAQRAVSRQELIETLWRSLSR